MAEALAQFEKGFAREIERLLRRAEKAAKGGWEVSAEAFTDAVCRSVRHRFSKQPAPSPVQIRRYLESLHAEDLALACACCSGSNAAWEHFVNAYRPVLRSAAQAIAGRARHGGEAAARELADSLFAELYSLAVRSEAAAERSLLDYYHGRSSLATWLRAVLAQRWVDVVRGARRTESLDETPEAESTDGASTAAAVAARLPSAGTEPPDPHRARYLALLESALQQALGALAARERLRLSLYYLQEMTLAEIGRVTGESEATVSRKLERTRRELRAAVEAALGRAGLSPTQAELCYEYAQEEWFFDLAQALASDASPGAEAGEEKKPAQVQESRLGSFHE